MSVILDGSHPLWATNKEYLRFVMEHNLDIWLQSTIGDENAALLVDLVILALQRRLTEKETAAFRVVTERYIHDHHPDIATIQGGYPRNDVEHPKGLAT